VPKCAIKDLGNNGHIIGKEKRGKHAMEPRGELNREGKKDNSERGKV